MMDMAQVIASNVTNRGDPARWGITKPVTLEAMTYENRSELVEQCISLLKLRSSI